MSIANDNNSKKQLHELIDIPVLLAPMVGLSHVSMRKSLKLYLPENTNTLWATEMLNSRRLPHQDLETTEQTLKYEQEKFLYPQLLGNEEGKIKRSSQILEKWGAVAIDINMGCPVKKALKHNYGVSLMGDIEYAAKIVKAASQNTKLPVSVKLRAGTQKDERFLLNFCGALIESGASWLTLHPRLAGEKRKGSADWEQIKLLKDNFNTPIIGNGDLQCIDDIKKMFDQTGCDAVMIGRALTCKPWLLQYIQNEVYSTNLTIPTTPQDQAQAYGRYLKEFILNTFMYFCPKSALKRVKFFVHVGHVWLNFGHSLNRKIFCAKDEEELIKVVDLFFKSNSLMISKRSNLRY